MLVIQHTSEPEPKQGRYDMQTCVGTYDNVFVPICDIGTYTDIGIDNINIGDVPVSGVFQDALSLVFAPSATAVSEFGSSSFPWQSDAQMIPPTSLTFGDRLLRSKLV